VLVLDCEPVDDAPVLDLRIRKGVRRNNVKLAVATSRPSSLDPNARAVARFAPGAAEAFCAALSCALGGSGVLAELAAAGGADAAEVQAVADLLSGAGEDVVIVYGERLAAERDALKALLNLSHELGINAVDGAGLLEIPAGTNGRGLREAGCLPDALPGYSASARPGLDAAGIARLTAHGDLTALYLLHADPVRTHPDAEMWRAALAKANLVVAHASVMTDAIRDHADVIFPAESYAEKEGTVTHPDGRVQRLRPAIGRPGSVRAEWQVISDLAHRLGLDLGVLTGSMATKQVVESVAFYRGLTLDVLAGHGVRWPDTVSAAALPGGDAAPFELAPPKETPHQEEGELRVGGFESVWSSPEVELSPALAFLHRGATAELSAEDARRIGVRTGQTVVVAANGTRLEAEAVVRQAVPGGTVFLSPQNAFSEPLVSVVPK
jgi:NADH-quinone oxidoreductase subunit G